MDDNLQNKIFSYNLNKLLSMHEVSQAEAAKAIGVSPQTFNTWSKGIAIPRMGSIQKLADYFNVNKSDLIDCKNESNQSIVPHNEVILMSSYRKLNSEGQQRVIEYTDDLLSSGKYSDTEDPFAEVRREVANIKIPKAE